MDSWCTYQKTVAKGESLEKYKHKNSISPFILDAVKDIFKDLSMPSLLKRCLGGHTQNANESLNSVIWKLCPKISGSGPNVVQLAVNEAVVLFNEGQRGRIKTMQQLEYKIGEKAITFALEADNRRIASAEKKIRNVNIRSKEGQKKS